MQRFIRCFPWYSCQGQLQLGLQSTTHTHTRTQKESWSQAHPITYINNNAPTPARCINTYMLVYWLIVRPVSVIIDRQLCVHVRVLSIKTEAAFSLLERNTFSLSLHFSPAHVVTTLKGNADPLGESARVCVRACACVRCWYQTKGACLWADLHTKQLDSDGFPENTQTKKNKVLLSR